MNKVLDSSKLYQPQNAGIRTVVLRCNSVCAEEECMPRRPTIMRSNIIPGVLGTAFLCIILGATSGCGSEEAEEECNCTLGTFDCLTTSSINICEDGCMWTTKDCRTVCTEAGYDDTIGCVYESEVGHDACMCFNEGGIGDKCDGQITCAEGFCGSSSGMCTDYCLSNYDCIGDGLGG